MFFADGKLGALFSIESPYQQKIPFLIAQVYSGRSFSANTGYWGDAYANLGSLGVILFSLILAMVIKLIESITRNIAPSVVLSSFLFTILSLNDSALLVEFLTGGFGLLIIIYYMFDSYLYFQRQQTEDMDSIRKGRYLLSGNTRKSLLKGRLL